MPWQVYNSAGQLLQATDLPDNAVTNAKVANNAIDSAELVAGSVDNAHLADDAVNSDELAAGAVALAHLSASGSASSSTFLRGDNSWAAAGGGSLNFVATSVASGSTTSLLEVTLTGSYETYLITGSDLVPLTDIVELRGQFGASGSWGTDSWYKNAFHRIRSDGVHDMATSLTSAIQMGSTTGSATGEGAAFAVWFSKPIGVADTYPFIYGNMCAINHSTIIEAGHIATLFESNMNVARFKIYFTSGYIEAGGRLTVWGLGHA